jgi:hypothetical protein
VSREKGLAPISIAAFVVVMALLLSVLIHRRSMRSDSASAVSGTLVRVTFEGPWAFAADPDDANSIYAIAPKTEMHSDLQLLVPATESAAALEYAGPGVIKLAPALDAGLYEVLLKANRVPRKDAEIDPTFSRPPLERTACSTRCNSTCSVTRSGCHGRTLMWRAKAAACGLVRSILRARRRRATTP